MTRDDLIDIGFNEPSTKYDNTLFYDLGRDRILSVSYVGTGDEILFIGELGGSDGTQITDQICIQNYVDDGALSVERVYNIIGVICSVKNKSRDHITNTDLLNVGFTVIPHFTVMNSVIYDLGDNRQLSAGNIGNHNEMLYLCEVNGNDITDLVCLHNYDYEGYLTIGKVNEIIEWFK